MKVINALLVIWMLVLTVAHFYMLQTHKQFLKFEGMIMSDNFKNQVMYDRQTFYLYTVVPDGYAENDERFPTIRPVYIEKSTYEALVNTTRIKLAEKGVH